MLHHIAADGWSLEPLWRDFADAYAARRDGGAPVWESLPVQYADYTLWQRDLLGDEGDPESVVSQQLGFWQRELAGAPEQLQLPTDRPHPTVASHRGETLVVEWSPDLHARLRHVARACDASLFMVLHAGLAALLTRLNVGEDVVIGSVVAGRTDEALDDLVGFFVNTLVLRVDTSGDPTFRELVRRVRDTDLAAYENQDVPFEHLVDVLKPTRTLTHHPLFQVMLTQQNAPRTELSLPGACGRLLPVNVGAARVDLLVSVDEGVHFESSRTGLALTVEYNTDIFDRSTVESLLSRFRRQLETAVDELDRSIGSFDVVDAAERRRLLTSWNDAAIPLPSSLVLPDLFEQQVARTPDAVALVFEGAELTYRDLNARSNQLARHLVELGVGPEQVVGLAIPRSVEMVVAVLAVLKAGGAYLPIDPAYPANRIEFMLADARPAVVLTSSAVRAALPRTDATCLLVDDLVGQGRSMENVADSERAAPLLPLHPAYVIYTSGSTGVPKGVVGLHAGLANRWQWFSERYPQWRSSTVLARSSLSFLDSATELLGTMLHGGKVVLAGDDVLRDPSGLVRLVAEHGVERVTVVPSLLRVLLDDAYSRSLASVRCWVTSGEALPRALVERHAEVLPDSLLFNLYGSSEASADSLFWEAGDGPVRVGRPVANTRVYVLDGRMRLVPPGVVGELYVAGVGLARGY
ncbi:AMP-binding protein, partial [Saccharopolyspora sp. NPDC050389]|uniref:non-ribosomal peptide synthetase n=1 Tax=Saccharopolyspora sp. NPDC050389 TaxID=3155516 RepID=UPI0033E10D23